MSLLSRMQNVADSKVDQMRIMDHVAHLAATSMKRSAVSVGVTLRAVRRDQLARESRATRDALVHQPIMSGNLYPDPSLIESYVCDGPASPRYHPYLTVAPRQLAAATSAPLTRPLPLAHHGAVSTVRGDVDDTAAATEDTPPVDLSRGLPRHPH